MNEKIKKAWEWTKEHKKEIALGACAAVVTACGIVLVKNSRYDTEIKSMLDDAKNASKNWRPEKLNVSDLGVGKLDDVMRYPNGVVELMVDNIPLYDMGALGDAIASEIPDIPGDNNVWALVSIKPNVVE